MARDLSLNARVAMTAENTGAVPVVLVTITHDDLDAPIRLSSDPTERLALDPLRYGTISDGEEYDFVLITAVLPDDEENAPLAVSLAFENVDRDMAAIVRAVTSPAVVDLRLVLAQSPDTIEEEYLGLSASRVTYDASRVTLEMARDRLTNEPWPAHRMTQRRFPGLYR